MSKKSASELFRSAFTGDDGEREKRSAEESRRAREEIDRITARQLKEQGQPYAAARRAMREAEEKRQASLAPSDRVSDEELAAMKAVGMDDANPDFEAFLSRHVANREKRKAEERRRLGLEPAGPHGRPVRPAPSPVSPGPGGRIGPSSAEPRGSREGSQHNDPSLYDERRDRVGPAPKPTSATVRGPGELTEDELTVARIAGVDPVALSRHINAVGAVRIAAGADVDEDLEDDG